MSFMLLGMRGRGGTPAGVLNFESVWYFVQQAPARAATPAMPVTTTLIPLQQLASSNLIPYNAFAQ